MTNLLQRPFSRPRALRVSSALQDDQVEASTQPRRWSVRSQLVVTAEPEDDGKRVQCQAIHTTLVGAADPFASSITLSVLRESPAEGVVGVGGGGL